MIDEIRIVGGSVLTLFLMMAVGVVLGKRGMLSNEALSQMSKLLLCIAVPCIMVDTLLAETCNYKTICGLLTASAVLVGIYVLSMVLVQLMYQKAKSADRGVLRFAAMYGNTGFMGFPLIQAALGDAGMLTTVVSLAVFTILSWTHGLCLIGGRKEMSVRKVIINPGVLGFLISVVLFALQIRLPEPVGDAVKFLGSLNTPLAMIIIGGQIAQVNFREMLKDRNVYTVSLIKLIVIPVITMLVLLPLRLDSVMYMAVVILSACPVAGITSLFSQLNGKNTSLAARLVTVTTVFCIITLPLMCAMARMLLSITT